MTLTAGACSQIKQGVIAQSKQGRREHRIERLIIGTTRKQTHHRGNQLNFQGIREGGTSSNQTLKASVAQSLSIDINIRHIPQQQNHVRGRCWIACVITQASEMLGNATSARKASRP